MRVFVERFGHDKDLEIQYVEGYAPIDSSDSLAIHLEAIEKFAVKKMITTYIVIINIKGPLFERKNVSTPAFKTMSRSHRNIFLIESLDSEYPSLEFALFLKKKCYKRCPDILKGIDGVLEDIYIKLGEESHI